VLLLLAAAMLLPVSAAVQLLLPAAVQCSCCGACSSTLGSHYYQHQHVGSPFVNALSVILWAGAALGLMQLIMATRWQMVANTTTVLCESFFEQVLARWDS
jgi:hypothetical protein